MIRLWISFLQTNCKYDFIDLLIMHDRMNYLRPEYQKYIINVINTKQCNIYENIFLIKTFQPLRERLSTTFKNFEHYNL